MRLRKRALAAVGMAAALIAPAAASAHTFHARHHFGGGVGVPGYVYVNDNTATSNTVAGFRRWPWSRSSGWRCWPVRLASCCT